MAVINLEKLKNKHFLSLMGNAVISLLGLLQLWFLYKYFTKNDVGIWLVFMTTQSILDSIRNGFLGTATIKFYAGAEARRASDVMGSIWFLAISITGIMLLLNAAALPLLPHIHNTETAISIKWVGITILSSLPFTVIFWKLQADEQYGTILWMRLLNNGSTIIAFTVLLLLDKFTLESALLWNLITNSLTSIIGLLARLGGIKHIFSRTRLTIIEIVHFGKYSLATNLSSNLLGSANTYIINFMLGTGAVAILSVPSRLMELVEIPLRSFVGTGMSSMATAYNQKDTNRVISLLNKYSGMLTIAFIPLTLGVLLLADIPVNILSSGKYRGTEAANLYRLIMVIALIYPIDRFNGVTLDIIHQPRINFQKVQLMLVVKIAATFGCVYMLNSIYGVPLSGLITQVAGLAYGHYRLKQHLKVSIPEMLKVGIAETRQLTARILRRK